MFWPHGPGGAHGPWAPGGRGAPRGQGPRCPGGAGARAQGLDLDRDLDIDLDRDIRTSSLLLSQWDLPGSRSFIANIAMFWTYVRS